MDNNPFQTREPNIAGNTSIRTPQREAYAELAKFGLDQTTEREIGIVLPVGCGKSGCIALAPFAFKATPAARPVDYPIGALPVTRTPISGFGILCPIPLC